MNIFEKIAEDRIRQAADEGLFKDLPGRGKPLNLEDDRGIPEDMRMAFKILKNAGCLPIEMEIRKQVVHLQQLIVAAIDEDTRRSLRRELRSMMLKEAMSRGRQSQTR